MRLQRCYNLYPVLKVRFWLRCDLPHNFEGFDVISNYDNFA